MSIAEINRAIECLIIGKKPFVSLPSDELLESIAMTLSQRIDSHSIAPSKCAHAMCLSSANGYNSIVQMLSKRKKNEFNKAYNFDEPLGRAIRSWIKAKKDHDEIKQERCKQCAVYLIEAGANITTPEKYLKTKLTPLQRLENDSSDEARQLIEELTGGGISGKRSTRERVEDNPSHDAESKSSDPAKKRRRKA